MYFVIYPDPDPSWIDNDLTGRTAGTLEEAIETAEQLAAMYQKSMDRDEILIFDGTRAVRLEGEADPRRCPHCGEVITDLDGVKACHLTYDYLEGRFTASLSCPHCGVELDAYFDEDEIKDKPILHHLEV